MSKENFIKLYDKTFKDYVDSTLKYKKELKSHNETLENSNAFMKKAYDFREYIKVNNEKLFFQAIDYCNAKEKDRSDSTLKGR
tara:strand:+ start:750 stop:998 length:249 start_codon:yes stop_codon:yes gene_type:complete